MKSLIKKAAMVIVLSTVIAFYAGAQTTGENRSKLSDRSGIILSIGPDAGFPIGSMSVRYGSNFGGSVQADFPVWNNQLYVTTAAGFNSFFVKDSFTANQNDLKMIPVKAGLKYYPVSRLYVQAEAGPSFILNKAGSNYDKTASFAYSPSVGYQFVLSKGRYLDAGVRFEGNTKFVTNGTVNNFVGLRVAYSFGLK